MLLRSSHKHTWFDKVVISVPFVGLSEHFLPPIVTRTVAALATFFDLGRLIMPGQARRLLRTSDFPGNRLTSDISRFSRDTRTLDQAAHLGLAGPTLGWLNAAINSISSLWTLERIEQLRTPVLSITAAALGLTENVPCIATFKIGNARHELLNQRDEFHEQFWAAFDSPGEEPGCGARHKDNDHPG